ncbi:MAG TPA: replicative DNA helicase, partial [Armatimonadetes bacterium]|nr:replicative DNA helicase [Armatimonadota bacterium]
MRKLRAISPTDRLPPQSLEAEQSTLGAMLIGRDAVARAIELLQPEDFYRDAHRYIFEVALRLFDRGDPVDLVSVVTELQNSGRLEDVGGAAYLQTLIEQTPYATNVEYYAKIVREKATLRRLLEVATRIADWCYDSEDADETLDRAEQEILTIAQSRVSHDFVPIKPLLRRAFDEADQKFHAKSAVVGLSTGFPDLDYMTAGFQKSDLIIIAGRPAMGKTSLATNIAQYAAIHERKPVGIFSLEMSKEQLVQGMLCAQARINLHRWRTGHFSQDDWQRLARAIDLLNEAPIFIDDTPAMTPIEMRAKARRLRAEYGLGLIIVDYLQLMRATGRYDSRVQEISEITRSLKSLARELDVPLIACAQLSRAVEQRHDKRPMLSDLRESGQIEADADVVLFIYRESYYQRGGDKEDLGEGQEQLDETEIIIGK